MIIRIVNCLYWKVNYFEDFVLSMERYINVCDSFSRLLCLGATYNGFMFCIDQQSSNLLREFDLEVVWFGIYPMTDKLRGFPVLLSF